VRVNLAGLGDNHVEACDGRRFPREAEAPARPDVSRNSFQSRGREKRKKCLQAADQRLMNADIPLTPRSRRVQQI
jgi:hypothetical protein